jgi:hypothetical protein
MRKPFRKIVLVVVLAGAVLAVTWLHKLAFIGAGYAAQQTCACLFTSGRSLDSCKGDLDALAQRTVRLEPGEHLVRARAILTSATSRWDPVYGCMLEE